MSVTVVDNIIQLTVSSAQGPAGRPPEVDITDIEYDGSDRVISFVQNDVIYEIDYVTDGGGVTTATLTGGGVTRVFVTDALNRLISATVS